MLNNEIDNIEREQKIKKIEEEYAQNQEEL